VTSDYVSIRDHLVYALSYCYESVGDRTEQNWWTLLILFVARLINKNFRANHLTDHLIMSEKIHRQSKTITNVFVHGYQILCNDNLNPSFPPSLIQNAFSHASLHVRSKPTFLND
jgi:hypothetical protein